MMRFTLILIGLIICQFANTQNQDNKDFVVTIKTGLSGIFEEAQMSDYFSYKPGPAFALGLGYQHSLNKKGSILAQLHLQYAYAQTTLSNDVSDLVFVNGSYKRNRTFQNQYLQAPFYLGIRNKKITFSIGLSPTLHLRTKGIFEDIFKNPNGEVTSQSKIEKITGESYTAQEPPQDSYSRYIDHSFELQALLNISYQIKDWSIGFEFTHFLKDNFFVDETELYDSPSVYIEYNLLSRRSMLLVLSKRL